MSAVIGTLRAELAAGIAQFTSDFNKAANSVVNFERQFKRIGTGLAAGFGASQVLQFGKAILESASALSEQAQKLGVSVEAMQAYRIAFQQSGSSAQAADAQLARLNRTIGQAGEGSKAAISAFEGIGLSWDRLSKTKPDERLALVARGLLSIQDPARRAASEVALFGKSGQEIEAVLASLAPGIDALKSKFGGLIVSQQVADKADQAADRMKEAWTRTTTALTPFVANLAEAFATLVTNMTGIGPSLSQLERGLVVAEKMAKTYAGTKVGRDAQARADEIKGQIAHQKAQAAGIPFAGPGAVTAPAEGDIPSSVRITPGVDGRYSAEIEATRQFTKDRQQLFDDAARDEAEATQEFHNHRLEMIRAVQQREAEETQATKDQIAAIEDDYDQRQAERAQFWADNKLAITSDMFGNLARLSFSSNKTLAGIGKAAAITQATIDGVLGVQKALATFPPPINFAMAAAVGAMAAANVAQIAGMERGGRVTAGTPYIVGEKRPELFVPDTSGRIIPEVPGGSGGATINIHQTLNVMPDVNQAARKQVSEMMPMIAANTIAALQQAQRRGIV